jgi:hypothetical protein
VSLGFSTEWDKKKQPSLAENTEYLLIMISAIYMLLFCVCVCVFILFILFYFFTQASLEVIDDSVATLWFSGKEMLRGKKLMDFVGKNEKTKVIAKISKASE